MANDLPVRVYLRTGSCSSRDADDAACLSFSWKVLASALEAVAEAAAGQRHNQGPPAAAAASSSAAPLAVLGTAALAVLGTAAP